MGVWIELHCDNPAPILTRTGRPGCVSGGGNQPGAMTLTHPAATLDGLRKQAKKDGWLTSADGRMTCPKCASYWAAAEPSGGSRAD